MKPERRRHERMKPSRGLEVRCFIADGTGRAADRYNHAEKVVDVSARGVCLLTVGRLRMGVPMTVELFVPKGGSWFKSPAYVAWSTTVESRGRTAHVAGLHLERALFPEAPRSAPASAARAPEGKKAPPPSGPEPRRTHRRFSPAEVEIVCLPRGLLSALGLARNTGRRLKDLSLGGAQIVCSRKLSPGERVDLRLEFKGDPGAIDIAGVVRWCRRDTESLEKRYFAGVEFDRLPPGSETSLRAVERAFIEA